MVRSPTYFYILLSVLGNYIKEVKPVPTKRIAREIYPEIEPENDGNQSQVCIVGDVVYGIDEIVPAEQPCLKCRCQPPGVQCETIRCNKKSGCKAIHKPNKCCPHYECECEYNGKIYGNGEKLQSLPGDECRVCYCRGGEVKCAEVSCYFRDDCEGKRVPSQCCPKYDHCPPRTKNESSEAPLKTTLQTENEVLLKDDSNLYQINSLMAPRENSTDVETEKPSAELSKITIQEIIPDVKEIPITSPPKVEENRGQLVIEEASAAPTMEENDLLAVDSEPESSEVSEILQEAPSAIIVPDRLLEPKTNSFVTTNEYSEADKTEELSTSSSTHILSLIKRKSKPPTIEPDRQPSLSNDLELFTVVTNVPSSSPETTIRSITNSEHSIEQNPAYPPIPDIMFANTEENSEKLDSAFPSTIDSKIIPEILPTRNNKTTSENSPNGEWLKNVSIFNINATLPESLLNQQTDSDLENDTINFEQTLDFNDTMDVDETFNDRFMIDAENTTLDFDTSGNVTSFHNSSYDECCKISQETQESTTFRNVDLPMANSSQNDSLEELTTTRANVRNSSSQNERNVESLEISGESEESTTPKDHEALSSDENASVEAKMAEISEADDMAFSKEYNLPPPKTELRDVLKFSVYNATADNKMEDVEMIDASELGKKTAESTTEHHDKLPKPEKLSVLPTKSIEKRENSEDDTVFDQLDRELNPASEATLTPEEEAKESERIFKELLEETSTPKSKGKSPQGRNKETEALERVSQALAKFALRGSRPTLDTNILGVLTDFFSSQYRAYDSKSN